MVSKSALMMPGEAAIQVSRLDRTRVVLWARSAAYLLLALVALGAPLLLQKDKWSIVALAATAGALMMRRHPPLPKRRAEEGSSFRPGLTLLLCWFAAGMQAGLKDLRLVLASMWQPRLRSILP